VLAFIFDGTPFLVQILTSAPHGRTGAGVGARGYGAVSAGSGAIL